MDNARHYIQTITNLQIDLMKDMDSLTVQELSDIKRHARCLYENLVWVQYEAERVNRYEV